jgi:hypothetical protein
LRRQILQEARKRTGILAAACLCASLISLESGAVEVYGGYIEVNSEFGGKGGLLVGAATEVPTGLSNGSLVLRGEYVRKGFQGDWAFRNMANGEWLYVGPGEATVQYFQPSIEFRLKLFQNKITPWVYAGAGMALWCSSKFEPQPPYQGTPPGLKSTSESVCYVGLCAKAKLLLLDIRYTTGLQEFLGDDETYGLLAKDALQVSIGAHFPIGGNGTNNVR